MLTIILYVSFSILALAILSWLPGTKVLVSPVVSLITKLVEETFKHSVGYIIWFVKLIISSHVNFINNLIHHRSHFNPTEDFENKQ